MSEFRQILQHHLNQTRAGLYGQFEHALNFNTGPDQDALLKIAPGESITFTGKLTSGQVCSVIATNNLTGQSGAGFAAQRSPANDRTIVIPLDPQLGNATLEFSCPTGGTQTEVVSHVILDRFTNDDRWDAIDENLLRIFTKDSPGTRDIVSSQVGDYYVTGTRVAAGDGDGEMAAFDANGVFKWRAVLEDGDLASLVAYDDGSEVVGTVQIEDSGRGTVKVVGYDASLNVDQGAPTEPTPLYSTNVVMNLRTALYDFEADGNGAFIVSVRRNNEWDGAAGAYANIFKIDAVTGAILATFDTNIATGFARLAVCPVTGNIAVAPNFHSIPSGQSDMNLLILDSDLNFVSSDLVSWGSFTPGISIHRHVSPTFDETGRIFFVTSNGFMLRYTDSTLTVRDKEVNLFAPALLPNGRQISEAGNNLNGNLILGAGGPEFNNEVHIFHFDNDGILVSDYLAPGPGGDLAGGIHVRPASGPGPDLGSFFTQERSLTPPGRQRSVAAVKYADGNITGIFFNSVNVEFDHASWTAEHSIQGPVQIDPIGDGGMWEYNSPI